MSNTGKLVLILLILLAGLWVLVSSPLTETEKTAASGQAPNATQAAVSENGIEETLNQESEIAACTRYYSVVSGDTLGKIASRYNISVADLQEINGIANPDLINVGQSLCIPGASNANPKSSAISTTSTSETKGKADEEVSVIQSAMSSTSSNSNSTTAKYLGRKGDNIFSWPVRIANTILCSDESAHRARGSVNAWDFCVPLGTKIYAAAAGIVYYAGCNNSGGYGCWVAVKHKNGFSTYYCHMIKGSIRVKAGDTVNKDSVLGKVGWTGMTSYGPHTHFEIRHYSAPLPPSQYLTKPKRQCRTCNFSSAD